MSSSETFEQLVERMAAASPDLTPAQIEGIVIEEHDLLTGLTPGDVVPAIVAEATAERVARLSQRRVDVG